MPRGLFGDLRDPRWLYAKGLLFLIAAAMAAGLLLWDHPDLRTASLLAITVWCSCRAYYFAFYVIEHYIDGRFRYAGLGDFLLRLWRGDLRVGTSESPSWPAPGDARPPPEGGPGDPP